MSNSTTHCIWLGLSEALAERLILMHLMVEVGDQGSLEELIWHQLHLREGVYLYKGSLTDFYISEKCNLKRK